MQFEIVSKNFWQTIFLRYRKFFELCFFYKEIRMRNFYIGLLLDYILFVLLTFVIYCSDQSIETVFGRDFLAKKLGQVSVFWVV